MMLGVQRSGVSMALRLSQAMALAEVFNISRFLASIVVLVCEFIQTSGITFAIRVTGDDDRSFSYP
jgi:hypothetical protein